MFLHSTKYCSLCLHKMYKLKKFKVSFRATRKKGIKQLKQIFYVFQHGFKLQHKLALYSIIQNCSKLLPHFSSFLYQTFLNHLFNNGNTTLLRICYFILGIVAFLVHIKLPFLLAQMWHISNSFHLSCMFVKNVNKSW